MARKTGPDARNISATVRLSAGEDAAIGAAAAASNTSKSDFMRAAIETALRADNLLARTYAIPKLQELRDQIQELYGHGHQLEVTLPERGYPLAVLPVSIAGRPVPSSLVTGEAVLDSIGDTGVYQVHLRHPDGPVALAGIVPAASNTFSVAVEVEALPDLLTDDNILHNH